MIIPVILWQATNSTVLLDANSPPLSVTAAAFIGAGGFAALVGAVSLLFVFYRRCRN